MLTVFFLSFLPAASVKEAASNVPSPAEDKWCKVGEQTAEPPAEAAEHCKEAAKRAEETATGREGCQHQDATAPGDVQEETR